MKRRRSAPVIEFWYCYKEQHYTGDCYKKKRQESNKNGHSRYYNGAPEHELDDMDRKIISALSKSATTQEKAKSAWPAAHVGFNVT